MLIIFGVKNSKKKLTRVFTNLFTASYTHRRTTLWNPKRSFSKYTVFAIYSLQFKHDLEAYNWVYYFTDEK